MDTITWSHQDEIGLVKPSSFITSITTSSSAAATSSKQVVERKVRPQKEKALHCPRCNSTNTKFCYYNNYSLTQPRYFCKTCRRYWTEGGSLRNVPVGGGSRKNKRPNSSSTSTSNTSCIEPLQLPLRDTQNPKFSTTLQSDLYGLFGDSSASTTGWSAGGGLDLLMTRNPFAQVQMMEAGQGLGLQGLIRSDAVDDRGSNYGCMQGVMLPLQEMGKVSADDVHVMNMIRGGINGCDSANPGGVWNW